MDRPLCEDTWSHDWCASEKIIFSKKQNCANEMSEPNNISFDLADPNDDRENKDPSLPSLQQRRLMSGSFLVLGNLTHKNNEHIINAIMRQADRTGLIESLGYPNRTVWIRDNIPIWFGTGGILSR
jgi:hypothetical protein